MILKEVFYTEIYELHVLILYLYCYTLKLRVIIIVGIPANNHYKNLKITLQQVLSTCHHLSELSVHMKSSLLFNLTVNVQFYKHNFVFNRFSVKFPLSVKILTNIINVNICTTTFLTYILTWLTVLTSHKYHNLLLFPIKLFITT